MNTKYNYLPEVSFPLWFALWVCSASLLFADTNALKFGLSAARNEAWMAQIRSGMNILEFAEQQMSVQPRVTWQGWIKLAAQIDAGFESNAVIAFDELTKLEENSVDTRIEEVFGAALGERKMLSLAMRSMEWSLRQPHVNLSGACALMLAQIEQGWSFERAVRWIESARPDRVDPTFSASRYEALHGLYTTQGRLKEIASRWMTEAQKNPTDHVLVRFAIKAAMRSMRDHPQMRSENFLEWLRETYHPELASRSQELGLMFANMGENDLAFRYLQMALTIPLTNRDEPATPISDKKWRELFKILTVEAISELQLKVGRTKEAQAEMLKAREMRQFHKIDENAAFAGWVQSATGSRDVEDELRRKEALSEKDPEYWMERSSYYCARNDLSEAINCLRQGLVCPMGADPSHTRMMIYDRLFSTLDNCLREKSESQDELVELARSWLRRVPAESQLANKMATWLSRKLRDRLTDADLDSILPTLKSAYPPLDDDTFTLLASRVEMDRLWFSYVKSVPEPLNDYRSRAIHLAEAYLRAGKEKIAFDILADPRLTQSGGAWSVLVKHYIHQMKWREAENALMEGLLYGAGGYADTVGELAVMADVDGDGEGVLRLCKLAFSIDPMQTSHLERLAKSKFREPLLRFFRELEKRFPLSPHPAKSINALASGQ